MDISQFVRILDFATELEDAVDGTALQIRSMRLPGNPDTEERNHRE